MPRLTASEARFARWLEARLGFVGASTFVLRCGLPVIRRALYDGVLVWWEPPAAMRGVRGRWKVNPAVKNPGGFLRWLVSQRVRPGG